MARINRGRHSRRLCSVWLGVVRSGVVVKGTSNFSSYRTSQSSNVSKIATCGSLFPRSEPQRFDHRPQLVPWSIGRRGVGLLGHVALLPEQCRRPGSHRSLHPAYRAVRAVPQRSL